MKRYSTPVYRFVALVYMAFPVVYLLGAAILFDVPGSRLAAVAISPSFLVTTVLAMTAGYGLWEVRRWAWHVFVAANVCAAYLNVAVATNHGATHHGVLAVLSSFALLGAALHKVTRELRVPYLAPRIRWWETNPRYRLDLPARIRRSHSEPVTGSIMDLSAKGCFVRLREDIPVDARVEVEFQVFGQRIDCVGTIVWAAESSVTHPKGVGIRFDRLPRPVWKRLRLVTRRLKRLSSYDSVAGIPGESQDGGQGEIVK